MRGETVIAQMELRLLAVCGAVWELLCRRGVVLSLDVSPVCPGVIGSSLRCCVCVRCAVLSRSAS